MVKLYKLDEILQGSDSREPWQLDAVHKWKMKMTDRDLKFPCIPAVLGFTLNHLRYGFIGPAEENDAAKQLADLLQCFGEHSRTFGPYTSLVVFIHAKSEAQHREGMDYYEQLFWSLLSCATEFDRKPWPVHVPDDPSEHLWEFCYGGEPYFVYCGTPAHTLRRSRSFPYMVLAFTPRWVLNQFNAAPLRAEKTKQMIRKRLHAYDPVPPHPDLNLYGAEDNYEWRQYFLHDSEDSLPVCPFARMYRKYENKT
ncbi:YqcI/YcgG family protein [Paenibacillus dakarensis]|uniref:YqcI/YcgG family protein n=1 Tax=Paenibacillus dakarensis TaxID=1527293 RepID=UPI0006D56FDE|nr:YqcI/YcgG family protein [Paenibacillus dakarensis]